MTRRHFRKLAEHLRDVRPLDSQIERRAAWVDSVQAVARTCEVFNPAFDRRRFFEACGFNPMEVVNYA